ncbi:hypothetical protein, partial [Sanguibacteroides sp. AM78-02pH3A]|uniref:hypothetical protein n=1 Tax=Sanguibacteroides sp. AM78-02pH3A TaxID=3002646 RepID=UPI0022DF76DA
LAFCHFNIFKNSSAYLAPFPSIFPRKAGAKVGLNFQLPNFSSTFLKVFFQLSILSPAGKIIHHSPSHDYSTSHHSFLTS